MKNTLRTLGVNSLSLHIARVVYAPTHPPTRPPRPVDLVAFPTRKYSSIFEHIRVYLSIFEYIRGIFKEYSVFMSSTPGSCPA
jgi:hypothetical protein